MDHFAGLDVSVKETSICIVDDAGKIVREVKVASEPEALLAALKNPAYHFKRIGLEAGPLSQWLFSALAEAGLPVICVETRHMQAVLKAQINKTDRNDARGIAQMMRAGLYRPVHVKTLRSQKLRMLLTHRKLLQSKAIAIENEGSPPCFCCGIAAAEFCLIHSGAINSRTCPLRTKSVANAPDGWRHLLDWLIVQKIQRVHACLESTGRYSLGIACALYEAGHVVSIITRPDSRLRAHQVGSQQN